MTLQITKDLGRYWVRVYYKDIEKCYAENSKYKTHCTVATAPVLVGTILMGR